MVGFVAWCTTPPSLIYEGLALFDDDVRRCFAECTMVDTSDIAWQQAQLSFSRGGLELHCLSLHSSAVHLQLCLVIVQSKAHIYHISLICSTVLCLPLMLLLLIQYQHPCLLRKCCLANWRTSYSLSYSTMLPCQIELVCYQFHHAILQHGYL